MKANGGGQRNLNKMCYTNELDLGKAHNYK